MGSQLPRACVFTRENVPDACCFGQLRLAGGLLFASRRRWGMALRLRYRIESPRAMREHLHFVDGTGYFFFPSALAPKGTLASLQVDFWLTEQVMMLRGWVWARSTGAGIWL